MVAAPAGPSRISAEAVTVLYVRVRVDGFFDEGAVWSPATIACLAMVEQLGLFVACQQRGFCRCYINGSPLHNELVAVKHGDLSSKVIIPEVMLLAMQCSPRPLLADLLDLQGRCQSVPRGKVLRRQARSVLRLSNRPSKSGSHACFLPKKKEGRGFRSATAVL